MRTGTIVRTLETKSSVTSAEVSQDGRYITTADGSTVKFWDANQYVSDSFHSIFCYLSFNISTFFDNVH